VHASAAQRLGSNARRLALFTAAVTLVLSLSGCYGPPNNASQDIKQMAAAEVLTVPPPGGVLLGRAEDLGSTSPGSARDPGIALVFAAATNTVATANYYKDAYSSYPLGAECCTTATQIQLVGRPSISWASVLLSIRTSKPYLPDHFDLTLKPAPPGTTVYVTVLVTGQPGEGPP
jgi:hypothetical protein